MAKKKVAFTVFTKPWKIPLPKLGRFVKDLGFDGVELPIRSGYQVEPEKAAKGLTRAAKVLADFGVKIGSIAGPTDERTFEACAKAGVPIIRVCVGIDRQIGYMASALQVQKEYDALLPLLEKYGVAIGVQNHCDYCVCNAMGIRHLIEKYDPRQVCAVLDFAHCGLNGELPEMAIDIVWSHLRIANFKNAFWRRVNGPEAQTAEWECHWTTGRHGLASWPLAARELMRRNFTGDVCLTAEYDNRESVDRLIAEDIRFAKSLFTEEPNA